MGLMLGVELNSAELAKQVAAQMMERHIIINRTSETVLRFLPPYILENEARRDGHRRAQRDSEGEHGTCRRDAGWRKGTWVAKQWL